MLSSRLAEVLPEGTSLEGVVEGSRLETGEGEGCEAKRSPGGMNRLSTGERPTRDLRGPVNVASRPAELTVTGV